MSKPKKLPSGNWRARAYAGRDPVTGKQIFVSFTAETKEEAAMKASEFAARKKERSRVTNLTVTDAIERYISAKKPVLSASTIRGYKGMQRNYYAEIGPKKVYSLTTEDMQLFISNLTLKVSPKTVSNAYGLLSASVALFRPDAVFRVTLPAKHKKRSESPSDAQIIQLYGEADTELQKCIALAAFGSMRRGEICALKHKDVNGLIAYVHADMIRDENNNFVYKDIPKTSESNRFVRLPAEVVNLLGDGLEDGFIIGINPEIVTQRFIRLRDRLELPDIRFHDLRHYYASIGPVLGIPDTYMSAFGGWRPDSPVMKQVYQNRIADVSTSYAETMSNHFSKLINPG